MFRQRFDITKTVQVELFTWTFVSCWNPSEVIFKMGVVNLFGVSTSSITSCNSFNCSLLYFISMHFIILKKTEIKLLKSTCILYVLDPGVAMPFRSTQPFCCTSSYSDGEILLIFGKLQEHTVDSSLGGLCGNKTLYLG